METFESVGEVEKKISEFKANFEAWLKENQDLALKIKESLLRTAGLSEDELTSPEMGFDFGFIKVPVSELVPFGTSCGNTGNKCFSEEIVKFLQSKGVEFVAAIGQNKELRIASAAMHIPFADAEKFSKMIDKNNGSLRADNCGVPGWRIFESE